MIEIRRLIEADMPQAIELKILCWSEELAGCAENTLAHDRELAFWLDWMRTAARHGDIRVLTGAFEDGEMLGVAFASLAEAYDIPDKGIELNGLWVYPRHRAKGISLRLLTDLLDFFSARGMEGLVVYNPHYAPSNGFYRKFGASVVRRELQMDGRLPVDVFKADIAPFRRALHASFKKYSHRY